jgi:ABC-type uncharacterized transport system permease subunit
MANVGYSEDTVFECISDNVIFFLVPKCHVGYPPTFRQSHIWKKQARLAEKSAETSPRTIMALATAVIAVACCNVFWLALKRTENLDEKRRLHLASPL